MSTPLVIGTSIAPKGIDSQRRAVESWLALGFEVLSLNVGEEIATLRPEFPGVRFVAAERTASARAGRPLVYFDDLLGALAATGRPVIGIVNSDVLLRADRALADYVAREARGAFLFGSRVDVDTPESEAGAMFEGGYDFFFFDRSLVGLYPKTDYSIGLPWWDYWAPMVPALNGVPLKRLTTPIAFHVRHDLNWQSDTWLYYASIFARYVTLGFEEAAKRQQERGRNDADLRWMHFVASLWTQLYRDRVQQYQFTRQIVEKGSEAERARFKDDIGAAEFLLVKHYGNLAESSCAFIKTVAEEVVFVPEPASQAGST
ncbi:MAG: hypothetical protein WD270_10410 [Acetobacterales bacterium]